MNAKVVGNHLHVDGYVYVRSRETAGKIYWDCNRVRRRECRARAISTLPGNNGAVTLYKGPNESKHAHAPNVEAVAAEELTLRRNLSSYHLKSSVQNLRGHRRSFEPAPGAERVDEDNSKNSAEGTTR